MKTHADCPVCGQKLGGRLNRPDLSHCKKESCAYNFRTVKCPKCKASGHDNLQKEVSVEWGFEAHPWGTPTCRFKYECRSCKKTSLFDDLIPAVWS